MVSKASKVAPFTSAASLKMVDSSDPHQNTINYGSVFLITTDANQRDDIVLGAGHCLTHLSNTSLHVEVEFYGNRDVNSVKQRKDDSFCHALEGTVTQNDFGVARLAEGVSGVTPLRLVSPKGGATTVEVAGAVAAKMLKGDNGIWTAETSVTLSDDGMLYGEPGVTFKGMSGGPVFPSGATEQAIGLVNGDGEVKIKDQTEKVNLYVALTAANIKKIDALIAKALAE